LAFKTVWTGVAISLNRFQQVFYNLTDCAVFATCVMYKWWNINITDEMYFYTEM